MFSIRISIIVSIKDRITLGLELVLVLGLL